MNKAVFVDADVIIDLLCKREPFYATAAELFTLADQKRIHLVTTAVVFANVFYILRKLLGIERAKELLRKLRILLGVMVINEKIIDLSLNSKFSDFEDALQYFSARENGIPVLLTRNIKDYKEKDLIVQTPDEYVRSLVAQ